MLVCSPSAHHVACATHSIYDDIVRAPFQALEHASAGKPNNELQQMQIKVRDNCWHNARAGVPLAAEKSAHTHTHTHMHCLGGFAELAASYPAP